MQNFAFVALEPSGKRQSGIVEAPSKEAAITKLSSEGRFVLEIKEQKAEKAVSSFGGRASASDVALFTRRLADLSEAGLPLDRVLQVVAEQSESKQLHDVALAALEEVRGGKPVSDALAMHPKLFSEVFTQTLKAGEASGQFSEVAGRLAEFQEMEVSRKSTVVSALIYPAILGFTALSVVAFLITYVIPKLSDVFKDLGGDLPASTQLLLGVSNFVSTKWLIILAAVGGSILFYRAWVATDAGAYVADGIKLRLPLIGPVVRKSTVSRFARVLGTLVYGGVSILEAIHLAGMSSGNKVYVQDSQRVSHDVREGKPIAEAMRDTGTFPPVLTHMVAIGEETGNLPKMLGRVADSMDFEVDTGLRRLTAMAEPIIVLSMGAFVGFVVLSILLPIFQAQELVK